MTGFGRGQASIGAGHIAVELRSLNHRYLDSRIRLSSELSAAEEAAEGLLRSRFSRGRLELSIKLDGEGGGQGGINRELARRYLKELEELRQELGLTEPVSISVLAAVPEVFQTKIVFEKEPLVEAVTEAVNQAIDAALRMRDREGKTLLNDFESRLDHIEELLPQLRERAESVPLAAVEKLRVRLGRLIEGTPCPEIDEARLSQEMALLADRCDVTEELIRLASHLEQFRKICREEKAMGRRLEFLLQEMARESSTIGAKAQDATLQHLVVDLRGELARMREQIQNVE